MKLYLRPLALAVLLAFPICPIALAQTITPERARELLQKERAGKALSDGERKELADAKRMRDAQGGASPADREKAQSLGEKMKRGEKLNEEEQRFMESMRRRMGGGPGGNGGAEMEKMRAVMEKKQMGETLTAEEEALFEQIQRRQMAQEAEQAAGAVFSWPRAQAAYAKEQRGDILSDDEKKLLAEARKRFEDGRGPEQQAAAKVEAPAGTVPVAGDFDWEKARAAREKEKRGETLSEDERQLLAAAKKRIEEGRGHGGNRRPGSPGAQRGTLAAATQLLVPLDELKAEYRGQDGGLYGKGSNEPPAEHARLAGKAISQIQPLDREGKPSADGKVVLMSIGMSNTTMEFSAFVSVANSDPRKAPQVVIVDAAQGGKDATDWAEAGAQVWTGAEQKLERAGVAPAQVQAVWIKQALKGPSAGFPAESERLRDRIREIVTLAKTKYPNLRVAYLSSRIFAGYAATPLNPEPYSYESAFAVRWVIEEQVKGSPALNAEASKGNVTAPVLLWGPYLWANGETPRESDGLVFKREDLSERDGTHPSNSGREKVAKLLLDFFTGNPLAKPWFAK